MTNISIKVLINSLFNLIANSCSGPVNPQTAAAMLGHFVFEARVEVAQALEVTSCEKVVEQQEVTSCEKVVEQQVVGNF